MTTYYWLKPISGDWNTISRWDQPIQLEYDGGASPVADGGAVFATGSSRAYTVSGNAIADYVNVVGDHVNFNHFRFGSWGPTTFGVFGGASVSVGADSDLALIAHDAEGGFAWVDNSKLTVHGQVDLGSIGSGFNITNGSSVTVSGKGAEVGQDSWAAGRIDQTSRLTVSQGGNWGVSSVVDGTINLAKGTLSAGISLTPTASLTGYGTAAYVANDGVIRAHGGTLHVGGTQGSGGLVVDGNAKLDLGASTSENVTFNGSNAWLLLEPGVQETGFIAGFGNGDKIETVGQNLTSLQLQDDGVGNTIMNAFAGANVVDTFHFAGHLSPQLKLQHDGHGNSIIAYSNIYQMNPALYVAPIHQVV